MTSKRLYTKGDLPASQPCVEPLPTHASTGTLQLWQLVLVQSPVGSLLPSSGSWCTQKLVCALRRGVSVSSSPLEVVKSNPADPQVQICWGFPVLVRSQAGKPDVGFRAIPTVGELLSGCCRPVCGSRLRGRVARVSHDCAPSTALTAASLPLCVGHLSLSLSLSLPSVGSSILLSISLLFSS